MASSGGALGMGRALPSGAAGVDADETAHWMMRSRDPRSTTRSLITGKARGPPRLDPQLFAVAKLAHVELARRRRARDRGAAVDHQRSMPQMPSRQSWSNAIGSLPSCISFSLTLVEHLEERHVR